MFFLRVRLDLVGGIVIFCNDQSMVERRRRRERGQDEKKKKCVGAGGVLKKQLCFSGCLSINVFILV